MQSLNRNVMQGTRNETLEDAMQRGIAASDAGDKEGAYRIFQQITNRYPDAVEVWVWLGWNSLRLEESEAAFQRAYALNPTSEEARLGLRWVNSQRESAQQDAPRATPTSATVATAPMQDATDSTFNLEEQMQTVIASVEAGDKTSAYNTLRQIVASNPDLPEAWVWLGGTTPDVDEAESAFRHAIELDPDNEEARLGLRWVSLRRQVLQHAQPEDAPEPEPTPIQPTVKPYDTGELARQRSKQSQPEPEEKKGGFFSRLFGGKRKN